VPAVTRAVVIGAGKAGRARVRARLEGAGVRVVGEAPVLGAAPPGADVLVVEDEGLLVGVAERDDAVEGRAIVALADDARAARVLGALPLRGWAAVPADATDGELRAAVAAAGQGLVAFPRRLGAGLLRPPGPLAPPGERPEALTPREGEILELLGAGLSNRRIAARLGISEHTVKFHVASILGKLGAASRTDAVSRGLRRGLITL
jgi:DNA-binding NarL/FixJ family response regulator